MLTLRYSKRYRNETATQHVMWALPQRYEKATATLWKHDFYRNATATVTVIVTVTVAITVMLRLFSYYVAVAFAKF